MVGTFVMIYQVVEFMISLIKLWGFRSPTVLGSKFEILLING